MAVRNNKQEPNFKLKVFNNLLINEDFTVKEEYKNTLLHFFKTDISYLDLHKDIKQSLERINKLIENNTFGKIKNMLKTINPNAQLYLINTVFFKDNW
jgi:serpin B